MAPLLVPVPVLRPSNASFVVAFALMALIMAAL